MRSKPKRVIPYSAFQFPAMESPDLMKEASHFIDIRVEKAALYGLDRVREAFNSLTVVEVKNVILEIRKRLNQNNADQASVKLLYTRLGDAFESLAMKKPLSNQKKAFFLEAAEAYEKGRLIESAAYCYLHAGEVNKRNELLTQLGKRREAENEEDEKKGVYPRHQRVSFSMLQTKEPKAEEMLNLGGISRSIIEPPEGEKLRFFRYNPYPTNPTNNPYLTKPKRSRRRRRAHSNPPLPPTGENDEVAMDSRSQNSQSPTNSNA